VILLGILLTSLLCTFNFLREDKEEHITPMCPRLVVKDTDFHFRLPVAAMEHQSSDILNANDESIAKITMDWPDQLRFADGGVSATARLGIGDSVIGTVVARKPHTIGQGIALCRASCEIFGYIDAHPDGKAFSVRHRTGILLLTLIGNFDTFDVEGLNPVGTKVCWFQQHGDECCGRVLQHVDAGLVICALLAAMIHRKQVVEEA
jgi:hypothetical protein